MRKSFCTRCKRATCIALVSMLFLSAVSSARTGAGYHDTGLRSAAAVPDGAAAMLRIRIPIGGAQEWRRPSLSLTAGPTWREAEFSPSVASYFQDSAAIEIGTTFGGNRIVKLGGVDVRNLQGARLDGEEAPDHLILVTIVKGVVIVAGVLALSYVILQNDCNNNKCTGGVPVTN